MKPVKKIISLSVIVVAIALFWLMPNINQATTKQYTRLYEDTDNHLLSKDTLKVKELVGSKHLPGEPKKTYKKEIIFIDQPEKLKASMFSRSIHFSEEKVSEIDSVVEIVDTSKVVL